MILTNVMARKLQQSRKMMQHPFQEEGDMAITAGWVKNNASAGLFYRGSRSCCKDTPSDT